MAPPNRTLGRPEGPYSGAAGAEAVWIYDPGRQEGLARLAHHPPPALAFVKRGQQTASELSRSYSGRRAFLLRLPTRCQRLSSLARCWGRSFGRCRLLPRWLAGAHGASIRPILRAPVELSSSRASSLVSPVLLSIASSSVSHPAAERTLPHAAYGRFSLCRLHPVGRIMLWPSGPCEDG
jgi:hypothetical protein